MLVDIINALSQGRRSGASAFFGTWMSSPWQTDPTSLQVRRCFAMLRAR